MHNIGDIKTSDNTPFSQSRCNHWRHSPKEVSYFVLFLETKIFTNLEIQIIMFHAGKQRNDWLTIARRTANTQHRSNSVLVGIKFYPQQNSVQSKRVTKDPLWYSLSALAAVRGPYTNSLTHGIWKHWQADSKSPGNSFVTLVVRTGPVPQLPGPSH